jgi:hypothetical protein
MSSLESAVLTAWYCSRPEIRRLLALKDAQGLRVLLALEPAPDSDEIHPVWIASHRGWTRELSWHTGAAVRIERMGEVGTDDNDVVIADLAWRDPTFN